MVSSLGVLRGEDWVPLHCVPSMCFGRPFLFPSVACLLIFSRCALSSQGK